MLACFIIFRCDSDPDYEENFLKPELIKMIMRTCGNFFDDNEIGKLAFRDKVIQCVKLANEVSSRQQWIGPNEFVKSVFIL